LIVRDRGAKKVKEKYFERSNRYYCFRSKTLSIIAGYVYRVSRGPTNLKKNTSPNQMMCLPYFQGSISGQETPKYERWEDFFSRDSHPPSPPRPAIPLPRTTKTKQKKTYKV